MKWFKKEKKYIFIRHWKTTPQDDIDKHNYYTYYLMCNNCKKVHKYQILFGIKVEDIKPSIECVSCHCYLINSFSDSLHEDDYNEERKCK